MRKYSLSNAMLLRSGLKIQETTKNKKTSITVKVGKVPGATSYEVYVQYFGSNGFSENPTGTIKNGKTSITLSEINGSAIQSGRSYKVRVIAKKGDTTLCRTPILHAAGSTSSYSDVKTMTLNKSAVTLAKGKTFTIKPKVTVK